ncbi:MAG: bis(5'-nucleosyl)-tetraphosphatase (symmetrical) YqeK [Clostridiales bacterium]|nr:bis(5'-nucleosyl)-tetraphosphatase (symmetrical) YqeK [Clostridiales bacterium]
MDNNEYKKYVDILTQRLSEYRFRHSLEVAKSAKHLAEKYGGDSEKMYLAGLLHDILKEAEKDEIFSLCEKYAIELTPLEKNAKKLWHAAVGAEYIKNELKIDDGEIISAVRYHTTGRKNMTLSDKMLFIADFISADRDYDGVDVMREKAEISLEDAMLEGLSFTIIELAEKQSAIHPDTIDAYNDTVEYISKKKGLI